MSELKIQDNIKNDFSKLPVGVLQFGEGNFLRAFADWYIERANTNGVFNSSVVIVKPTESKPSEYFAFQNYNYTVIQRGRTENGVVDESEIITSVSDFLCVCSEYKKFLEYAKCETLKVIISNTTEAGIVYNCGEKFDDAPNFSYPAKLCAFLYERYKYLGTGSGLLILPVELIENNGKELKRCVISYAEDWNLENSFIDYINNDCKFCSTLVDRIVTGFPKNDYENYINSLGYDDRLLVVCEPYNSWIIEGKDEWKDIFPIHKISDNVKWVSDISPYRERKVKILNGAHTLSVTSAYLAGYDIVRDMMHDELFSSFIKKTLNNEIMLTIDMDREELSDFAESVFNRFDNPFIDHRLLDIALNCVSKYRARCLPSVVKYIEKFSKSPRGLSFSLAALIAFYGGKFNNNGDFVSNRNSKEYIIRDSKEVCLAFEKAYNSQDTVKCILSDASLWGVDLTAYTVFFDDVKKCYIDICENGVVNSLKKVVNNG